MKNSAIWLVVGGDGLIGHRLAIDGKRFATSVVVSSRRTTSHFGRVFADLATGDTRALMAVAPDVVFLCAAITNMRSCRDNVELSFRVNVTETVNLAAQFIKQGAFVVFLSSNMVFNGLTVKPNEYDPRDPVTDYGLQKASAEQQLLAIPGADEQLAIVRFSKVLSSDNGAVLEFLRCFRTGENCQAFEDLNMAPISLRYAVNGLFVVAVRRLPGIFHFSGFEELSYAELARRLASYVGVDPKMVRAVSSQSAMTEVLFRPKFSALGMKRTRELLGIEPEPLNEVLDELSNLLE